jgi:hypothetical protein
MYFFGIGKYYLLFKDKRCTSLFFGEKEVQIPLKKSVYLATNTLFAHPT